MIVKTCWMVGVGKKVDVRKMVGVDHGWLCKQTMDMVGYLLSISTFVL